MYNQHIFFHHITSTSTCTSLVTMMMYTVHYSEVEHAKPNMGPENVWLVNVLCSFVCLAPPPLPSSTFYGEYLCIVMCRLSAVLSVLL
jgi:hypothetical protein